MAIGSRCSESTYGGRSDLDQKWIQPEVNLHGLYNMTVCTGWWTLECRGNEMPYWTSGEGRMYRTSWMRFREIGTGCSEITVAAGLHV